VYLKKKQDEGKKEGRDNYQSIQAIIEYTRGAVYHSLVHNVVHIILVDVRNVNCCRHSELFIHSVVNC
jgi:hypothetical protein